MSAPNSSIVIKRNEPLEDEMVYSLAELVAYVAGFFDISIDDAKQKVMKAIASGEFDELMRPTKSNH